MTDCFIGLGSNLADPLSQLRQSVAALAALPQSRLRAVSSLYASAPIGPPDQPDYLNAVAWLQTELEPLELLDRLQAIEQGQGRVRDGVRWGPRTLDLDILLYGNHSIEHPRLRVPHPQMLLRGFVLVPLAEIAPQLVLPGGDSLESRLAGCEQSGLRRLECDWVRLS